MNARVPPNYYQLVLLCDLWCLLYCAVCCWNCNDWSKLIYLRTAEVYSRDPLYPVNTTAWQSRFRMSSCTIFKESNYNLHLWPITGFSTHFLLQQSLSFEHSLIQPLHPLAECLLDCSEYPLSIFGMVSMHLRSIHIHTLQQSVSNKHSPPTSEHFPRILASLPPSLGLASTVE